MKEIPLTQGKVAIVDDSDYEWLNQHKWCAEKQSKTYYATRRIIINRKSVTSDMHREILGLVFGDGKIGDHQDRNGLNNQRYNLRIVSKGLNNLNADLQKNNKSGYRGVSWHKNGKKWQAHITLEGKDIYLGLFSCPKDAAIAYDIAARAYWKENAILNFP